MTAMSVRPPFRYSSQVVAYVSITPSIGVIGKEMTRDGSIKEKGHQEMRRAFSLWRSGSLKGSPSERTDGAGKGT
jgi:hypothetical protein